MSNECRCCGGRCGEPQPLELNRRDFLGKLAGGTAAAGIAGQLAWADGDDETTGPRSVKATDLRSYPKTPPRVYRGKHLEAVGMPLGGIGTGSLWLDGQGRWGIWQIFNNLSEPRIPDSFFAVNVRTAAGKTVTRVLQTTPERSLSAVESLDYEGGYPIARLHMHDAALPVEVRLEAMNPMVPLDTASSSIPCVLVRLTASNPGKTPVDVALAATLQNAVGSNGADGIQGVKFPGYGGNRNRAFRDQSMVGVALDRSRDPVGSGPVRVRNARGKDVTGPELLWLAGIGGLGQETAAQMARVVEQGGVVLADGIDKEFFAIAASFKAKDPGRLATVFEDFEGKTYEGWTITGEAFGKGPSHGTEAGQQPVTGFSGHGLVNTFQHGDAPQGTATSRPFVVERRYIGFLIGGGNKPGKTCINLRVGGKVVRTATGKDREALEPAVWDVADLKGKQAFIEIVDHASDGWGHINIDRIVFSDISPEAFLTHGTPIATVARSLRISCTAAEEERLPAGALAAATAAAPAAVKAALAAWKVTGYTRLAGFRDGDHGYRALAATPGGDPLLIEGPLGKGRIILALAPGLPWDVGSEVLLAARGAALKPGERLLPGSPSFGTMALATFDPAAIALPGWSQDGELAAFLADPAGVKPAGDEAVSRLGETVNAALAVPLRLQPGESKSATFAITWHFPNVQRFHHAGNLYSRRWPDAAGVARYLSRNLDALWNRTQLYHDTIYQSNLPEEFLDAMTSQSVIFRGPTCFWSEDGYFGGFEGSYGCCPLNCTHVWNYAQSHARLFPDVGRNMRVSNFITYLHETGETSHREHDKHGAFTDGHCACIEAALREHQLSPDSKFLEAVWPGVKKAVDWLVRTIDPAGEGVPHGHQPNTYDTSVSGANTFIGSQYLSALAAAERMARLMNDAQAADRWHAVLAAGMKHQDARLFNGEYYIQVPEPQAARDYNTGCHADQLLGQWWAHMLGLGYLYPPQRVKSALEAVMKNNFREKFAGFHQDPRRYIPDDEGGLIICTWPHGGRPNSFILYADEVWTGIEYAVAGAMVYEGLIAEARRIVRTARSRYDGRRRDGLNSGPGGNPFNELECGKFYARAMSSWSLLIASQGLVLDGPQGVLGFKPRWQPEDHRSFYTAPRDGDSSFSKARRAGRPSGSTSATASCGSASLCSRCPAPRRPRPA